MQGARVYNERHWLLVDGNSRVAEMKYVIGTLILFLLSQGSRVVMSQELPTSNIKSDERIVFFTTDARFVPADNVWGVPIHAWVHELDRQLFAAWPFRAR